MRVTYKKIQEQHSKLERETESVLKTFEDKLLKGRDEDSVPIYLTKRRVKSVDSIYLKLKRKPNSNITDRGGLRVLCLFQQDILPTFKYILEQLIDSDFILNEAIGYNWDSKEVSSFSKIVSELYSGVKFDIPSKKESGYKSIHFVATSERDKKEYPIEIQLRTLLQDVWGELEHSLAYKQGNIHPHIRKSFILLANDLQNNDDLISHLREVRDKETFIANVVSEHKPPTEVFGYDYDVFQKVEKKDQIIGALKQYNEHVAEHWHDNDASWVPKARQLFNSTLELLNAKETKVYPVDYWIDIEEAYLDFAEKKYDDALKRYKDVIIKYKKYSDKYVPHFRLGEIYLLKSEVVKSLAAFDECEEILNSSTNPDLKNLYLVKSLLANVYWQLGKDYFPLSVEEILDAEKILSSLDPSFKTQKQSQLINNICYYLLEEFIESRAEDKDKKFDALINRYYELEKVIETNQPKQPHHYDTASWFCYHSYLYKQDISWLEKACKFCMQAWDYNVTGTDSILSTNIRRNHMQEIKAALSRQVTN